MPDTLPAPDRASMPSAQEWRALSKSAEKCRQFAFDLYFRECWEDCRAVFGEQAVSILHGLAILCAKPDAVVGRRLRPMLDYVLEHGYAPLAAAPFCFNRHSMRAIWCHDWHVYPVDRLAFSTLWYCSGTTMLFACEDRTPLARVPASVRLAALKGDALATRRTPGQLRSRLAPPNRILNFVHVPDEPADVVRELGILFDRDARRALLRAIAHGRSVGTGGVHQALATIARLESTCPAHRLDVHEVLTRLAGQPDVQVDQLRHALDSGACLDWDTVCALLPGAASTLARWDVICVASHLIAPERPGTQAPMAAPDIGLWM